MPDKLYTEKLYCSKEDKELLENQCKKLFLDNHPEMAGFKITNGFMIRKLIYFWLKDTKYAKVKL